MVRRAAQDLVGDNYEGVWVSLGAKKVLPRHFLDRGHQSRGLANLIRGLSLCFGLILRDAPFLYCMSVLPGKHGVVGIVKDPPSILVSP